MHVSFAIPHLLALGFPVCRDVDGPIAILNSDSEHRSQIVKRVEKIMFSGSVKNRSLGNILNK
jgi:hypothetical protein